MKTRLKLATSSAFLVLLTGCPSTKNSAEVNQKNSFPSFKIAYSADSKVTTAYAQVWEDSKKRATLRLTGGATLSFEGVGMDLHDGDDTNWTEDMNGTYYRRSIYDIAVQSEYKFTWDKGDGTEILDALVKGAVAPKLESPAESAILKRKNGIKIKIKSAGYPAQDEKLTIVVQDERGQRIQSNDKYYFTQVGAGEFFLAGDKSWLLEAGNVFIVVTREVSAIERKPDGSILFETTAVYEGRKVPFTLVDED